MNQTNHFRSHTTLSQISFIGFENRYLSTSAFTSHTPRQAIITLLYGYISILNNLNKNFHLSKNSLSLRKRATKKKTII